MPCATTASDHKEQRIEAMLGKIDFPHVVKTGIVGRRQESRLRVRSFGIVEAEIVSDRRQRCRFSEMPLQLFERMEPVSVEAAHVVLCERIRQNRVLINLNASNAALTAIRTSIWVCTPVACCSTSS